MEERTCIPRICGYEIELRYADGTLSVPPPVPLSKEAHTMMEFFAEVYSKRLDLGPEPPKLPVLMSYGFALDAGDPPADRGCIGPSLMDCEGKLVELLLEPIVAEAIFELEAKFLSRLLRAAYKQEPDIDHRGWWIGSGSDLSPDGRMRIKIVYSYYVPDASGEAPDYINSPSLARYPTKIYPAGVDRVSAGTWFRRTIRDAKYLAPMMAVLFPFDDMLGLDFGRPELRNVIAKPFFGAMDGKFPLGVSSAIRLEPDVSDGAHQLVSYSWDRALSEVRPAMDRVKWGDPNPRELVEDMPAVMEMLRLQRGTVMQVTRLPLGGCKRRNNRTKKRNVTRRKARKAH